MSSAINTFLGVLFITVFLIAVTSRGALKGPDAFVLRWTVISLAIAFSALVAWLRWKMLQGAQPTALPAQVKPVPARREAPAELLPTGTQAIVFRQHFPPQPEGSTLSFFGGTPIVPDGFQWPRSTGNGKPFSFVMQIDCADVPASARLQLLPDRGVLYFFQDLMWGEPNPFRVLYEERVEKNTAPVRPPADLDCAYGASAWKWPQSPEDCPRLLPRWTFQPVAIAVPSHAPDPDDEGAPALWPGDKVMTEPLRIAQGEEVVSNWFTMKDFIGTDRSLIRPFANYPHDWRAVQIASGLLIHSLRATYNLKGAAERRGLSEGERDALVTRVNAEASGWYTRAASHSPFAAVPQAESDEFWEWMADKEWLVHFSIKEALILSIEASLAASPEAAARIPADLARRVRDRHALASRSDHGVFVTTPDRMLAPPVDVQGNQWERAQTHLLLLEMSSNEGLGHHFGEGVYQFWITPEDLKARRFDKVELTADAY